MITVARGGGFLTKKVFCSQPKKVWSSMHAGCSPLFEGSSCTGTSQRVTRAPDQTEVSFSVLFFSHFGRFSMEKIIHTT